MSILSENLIALCQRTGLSQNRLAQLSGVPQSSIARTMSGAINPRAATIAKIAKVFDMDAWALQSKPLSSVAPSLKIQENSLCPEGFKTLNTQEWRTLETTPYSESTLSLAFYDTAILTNIKFLNDYQALLTLHKVAIAKGEFVALDMPTDDLYPAVPKGSRIYIEPEVNQFGPDVTKPYEAVGVIGEKTDGAGATVFGVLSVKNGKTYVTPTNPTKAIPVEVARVTARVIGWTVLHFPKP